MKHSQKQTEEGIDAFYIACENIAEFGGFSLSSLLSTIPTHCLLKMSQTYFMNIIDFGKKLAEEQLQSDLKQAITTIEAGDSSKECTSPMSMIFTKKQRETDYDSMIITKWKYQRINFYQNYISNKLKELKVEQSAHEHIIEVLYTNQENTNPKILKELKKYWPQISQLKLQLKRIQDQFSKKQRECLPLLQIIEKKITSLRTIHIQYKKMIIQRNSQECLYSISAYSFFEVIHNNKMLSQVLVKGVQVESFQQFLKLLYPLNTKVKKSKKLLWMNHFSPSKLLKLTINTKLEFGIKKNTLSEINEFISFVNLFQTLSDMTVKIGITRINHWDKLLEKCLINLKTIKNIRIELYTQKCYHYQISLLRSRLFGVLSSFTSIAELSFINFDFYTDNQDILQIQNQFLSIEQNLRIIFEKNVITHLKMEQCKYFPILPTITTLQSLCVTNVAFRKKKSNLIKKLTQTNPNLRSINQIIIIQEWIIDPIIMNKLQTLIIDIQSLPSTQDYASQKITPSNIKYLEIINNKYQDPGVTEKILLMIFPKLEKLKILQINSICFDGFLLKTIPSLHLEKLEIFDNPQITDQGLSIIDEHWPFLKYIFLQYCFKLTSEIWSICEFQGLLKVKVSKEMLGTDMWALKLLKNRGIQVNNY